MKIFLRVLAVIWMILWGICALASFLSKETSYAPIFIVLMLMGLIPFFVGKKVPKNAIKPQGILGNYIDGIPNMIRDTTCILSIENQTGSFLIQPYNSTQNIRLSISQITNIGFASDLEIMEYNKSVIGRSIVGELLFGNLGAIVGGMSGTQKRRQVIAHKFLILNYTDKDSKLVAMSFEVHVDQTNKKLKQLIDTVKSQIKIEDMVL